MRGARLGGPWHVFYHTVKKCGVIMKMRLCANNVVTCSILAITFAACGPGGADNTEGARVTTLADVVDASDGETSLREAIDYALENSVTVDFESSLTGAIVLSNGAIALDGSGALTIDGEGRITIDAGAKSRVFEGNGPDLELRGLTLLGGIAESSSEGGGAIYMKAGALALIDCTLRDNKHLSDIGSGGAVHVAEGASLRAERSTFENNTARREGGAIHTATLDEVTLTACDFSGNGPDDPSSSLWGASIHHTGGDLTIEQSTFEDETSDRGALYITTDVGKVRVEESTFANNTSNMGAAIYFQYDGASQEIDAVSLEVTDTTFEGNSAATSGGAISAHEYTRVVLNEVTMTGNKATADGASGGGIATSGGLVLSGGSFEGNSAAAQGGLLYSTGLNNKSYIEVASGDFSGNSANDGGVMWVSFANRIEISGATFAGNRSETSAGALSLLGEQTSITGATFTDNIAMDESSRGGAIYTSGDITLSATTFSGNKAGFGGAIYALTADVTLDAEVSLSGNAATVDAGVLNAGGAICNDDGDVSLGGASVTGNSPDDFCSPERVM